MRAGRGGLARLPISKHVPYNPHVNKLNISHENKTEEYAGLELNIGSNMGEAKLLNQLTITPRGLGPIDGEKNE